MRLLNTNHKALYIVNKLFSTACLDPATAGEPWVGALHKALLAVVAGGGRLPAGMHFSNTGLYHVTLGAIPPSRRIILQWHPANSSVSAWAYFSMGPDGRMQWRCRGGASQEAKFVERDMKIGHVLIPSLRAHLQLVTDSVQGMPERI